MSLFYRGTSYQPAPSLEVSDVHANGKYRGVSTQFKTAASRPAFSMQTLTYRGVTYAGLR
ncbi:DUF4278 domain-containing protein [Pantanalinema sp. GBBB05]|uniref:DUF4278 domain-containing protein n=1 Tax=Pantanalinema sp. GBBB05 TaxID=2604139 RepID=UPI001DC386F6|nr:DUF4278 domain-containing protein [Pantanalinema sp. GBBB05]